MNTTMTTEVIADQREQTFLHALGAPTAQVSMTRIYCGDCIEMMSKLPDGIVDLTVTSPPYNIGKTYETPMAIEEYLDWCEKWIAEIHRLTSPTGAFWLNLGYFEVPGRAKALPIAYMLWNRIPFYIIQEVVWNYGAGVAGRRFFSPRNEKFLWCVKNPEQYVFNLDAVRDPNVKYPNQKKNGKLKCNPLGKNPSDVWQFPKVTSGTDRASKERTDHPAQFPVAVIDRIIRASSNEGDLVLDPFLGSGTTAEVCLATNRNSIGIEIRDDYIHLARQRLTSFVRRQSAARSQSQMPFGKDLD
jgi:adenine-specific DNA-methyltransferase